MTVTLPRGLSGKLPVFPYCHNEACRCHRQCRSRNRSRRSGCVGQCVELVLVIPRCALRGFPPARGALVKRKAGAGSGHPPAARLGMRTIMQAIGRGAGDDAARGTSRSATAFCCRSSICPLRSSVAGFPRLSFPDLSPLSRLRRRCGASGRGTGLCAQRARWLP